MKTAIVTIYDNNNYGNKLQNYALQKTLTDYFNLEVYTLLNNKNNVQKSLKDYLVTRNYFKSLIVMFRDKYFKTSTIIDDIDKDRIYNIKKFDKLINKSDLELNNYNISNLKEYFDYFVVGSDQVWNPHYIVNFDLNFLYEVEEDKKLVYAASYGISEFPNNIIFLYKKYINNFKSDYLGFREDFGEKFTSKLIGKKTKVVLDPTMLVDKEHWLKISQKPDVVPQKEYLLTYFLGDESEEKKRFLLNIKEKHKLEIINLMDKTDEYYTSGVENFLWLINNAKLVLTDSFHCGVFSILFNKPFYILNREGAKLSMNSRFETLLSQFNLKDRYLKDYNTIKIHSNINYTDVHKILEIKRKESIEFIRRAINRMDN